HRRSLAYAMDNIVLSPPAAMSSCDDSDGDGFPNSMDLDSDNDGIPDLVEAGGTDADGDGNVDDPTDTDGDGLVDAYDNNDTDGPIVALCTIDVDCDLSGSTSVLFDTDGDGVNETDADLDGDGWPNFVDIDADNDGIVDNIEGQASAAYVAPTGYDDDSDGLDNAYDPDCSGACTSTDGSTMNVTGVSIVPTNTDGEAEPDYLDTDADNDGESDTIEAYDTDDDGTADTTPTGTDADDDGLDDAFDSNGRNANVGANSDNAGQTPANFPNDDAGQAGGDQDWRDKGGSLPVEWVDFEVSQAGKEALLEWATAVEINSDFFEVQRSEDGLAFQPIGTEPAAGNTESLRSYRFTDQNLTVSPTGRWYYRLKQVDLDGTFSFSTTQELRLQGGSISLSVGPNPASETLTIRYTQPKTTNVPFGVFSVSGQQMYEGRFQREKEEISLQVFSWPAGTYFLTVQDQRGSNAKFVVQH
ncbi:MAG: T9SS type A sorting domain-containing protein, partial [Bacteroidota bacterium]